jgi:hypothetical protein
MPPSSSNVILYLAFGERYARQAVFSIASLLGLYPNQLPFRIRVITDRPGVFTGFSPKYPVEAVSIPSAMLEEWKGPDQFALRAKLCVVIEALRAENINLLMVDTDTIFLRRPDALFQDIERGTLFLHEREDILRAKRKADPALCPRDTVFTLDEGARFVVDDSTVMWNSGVVGITSSRLYLARQALELNDRIRQVAPSWHTEQLATGMVFASTPDLSDARATVCHYWHNKEMMNPVLDAMGPLRPCYLASVIARARQAAHPMARRIAWKHRRLLMREGFRDLPGVYPFFLFLRRPFRKPGSSCR